MKIGIVTPLWERGLSYTALYFYFALREKHETGVLAYVSQIDGEPRLRTQGEFDIPGLCIYPRAEIAPEDLKRWLMPYDAVLFMEERFGDYLAVAKEAKKKAVNYICEEPSPAEKERMKEFDLCIAPRAIVGTEYIPLGINLNLFQPRDMKQDKEKKRTWVFVPLGHGGDYDRKNEAAITKAISRVQCRDKAEFLVHKQGLPLLKLDHAIRYLSELFTFEKMILTYCNSDFIVYSPKWRRNDLTVMEAMACGLPVVSAVKPLGGMVLHRQNGLLSRAIQESNLEGVGETPYSPEVHDLAVAIAELSEDKEQLERMKINARKTAIEFWDWGKNKERFLKLMEGI